MYLVGTVTCILFLGLDCGDLVASNKYYCVAECEGIRSRVQVSMSCISSYA